MEAGNIVSVLFEAFGPLKNLIFGEKPEAKDVLGASLLGVLNVAKLGYPEDVPPVVIDVLTHLAQHSYSLGNKDAETQALMGIAELVAKELERKKFESLQAKDESPVEEAK